MKKVYICSPYRATNSMELDRNIAYAQKLTRKAIEAGCAPITPHLYITQCLNDRVPEERVKGMAAGLELLKTCNFIILGTRYGISEGMWQEIAAADAAGIKIVSEDKLGCYMECEKQIEVASFIRRCAHEYYEN